MTWLASAASSMKTLSITHAFGIYCGCFVLHELEEWNIARFERRFFHGLPAAHTDGNARAWIAVAVLLALLWYALASLPSRPTVAAVIFLPAVFVAATNGLQHVIWSIRFRTLAPGLVTAVSLMLPASACLVWLVLARDLVPLWYPAALASLMLLAVAATVKAGTGTPALIAIIYGIGDRARRLFVAPPAPTRSQEPRS